MGIIENEITKEIPYNGAGNILAKLFRKILLESGYNPIKLAKRLDQYVINNNRRAKQSRYVKSVVRSHLVRKLTSDEMTWKVFMDALFSFMNVAKLSIHIDLTYQDGKVSKHQMNILNNEIVEDISDGNK